MACSTLAAWSEESQRGPHCPKLELQSTLNQVCLVTVKSVRVPTCVCQIQGTPICPSVCPSTDRAPAARVQPASPTAVQPRGSWGHGLGAAADSVAGAQPEESLHSMSCVPWERGVSTTHHHPQRAWSQCPLAC